MTPFSPQPQQPDEVHLTDYLNVLMSRRKIFLLAFFAFFLGVALYTFTVKPVFEAFTTLQVQTPRGGKGDLLAELGGTAQNPVDTEIEIIKSRTMAEQVILRLQPPNAVALPPEELQDAANRLKSGILVVEVGKKTGIIRLSYQSTDPRRARDVVNTLAQVYQEHNVDFKSQEASKTLEFIASQLGTTQNDLDSAEKNLQAFKSNSSAVTLDAANADLVKRLAELDTQLSALGLQKKQLEFTTALLRQAIQKGEVHTSSAALQDGTGTDGLTARLAELDVQRQTLLSELSEGHPQVKSLKSQIDEVQNKLLSTYEATLKGISRQESALQQELGRYEGEFRKLPEAERELGRLLRVTKVNADIYTFLLQKHEEARITKAATISNISVVDPAITPATPIKPQKQKNLLLGLLAGLMLGAGLAFFIEYLDDTIKGSEEARRVVGAPILAVIPFIPPDEEQNTDLHSSMITHLRPKSAVAEAFRSLRTSLHFSAINREKKILIVTSTFPGEGKSTTAANLAIILSQTGARVLVIDGDLRRPSLHSKFGHSKFGHSKSPGLSEILAGDVQAQSILHETGIPNLSLLTAGTTPPNPAELLGSEKMADLLTALREQYDHIIIDAPPVLAVTDAPLLTSRCDLVLVVLETARVPTKAAQRMAEMLANVHAPVGGIVINDKSGASMERYGYYGRYTDYGYGYYAEDEETQADLARKRKQKVWWKRLFRG
jgi:tyrosine-protein kinase Etk/Wzc